jgi:hypothetical protein
MLEELKKASSPGTFSHNNPSPLVSILILITVMPVTESYGGACRHHPVQGRNKKEKLAIASHGRPCHFIGLLVL